MAVMIQNVSDFFTGQYKVLAWFILAIVFIYIPGWIILNTHGKYILRYDHDKGEYVFSEESAAG